MQSYEPILVRDLAHTTYEQVFACDIPEAQGFWDKNREYININFITRICMKIDDNTIVDIVEHRNFNTPVVFNFACLGFDKGHALCLPFGPVQGVRLGCRAIFSGHDGAVYPDDSWLGRVVNANGEPIDDKGPLVNGGVPCSLRASPLPAHRRERVGQPLDLGVRALNSFTTVCEGQRLGIFAGSGVGKSVLMSMLVRNTQCDVAIIEIGRAHV